MKLPKEDRREVRLRHGMGKSLILYGAAGEDLSDKRNI